MDIKLELTGEQINQEIIKAISGSLIGEELKKQIQEQVRKLSASYNNPFEAIVKQFINQQVAEQIRTTFKEQIVASVKERLTPEFIDNLIKATLESIVNKY